MATKNRILLDGVEYKVLLDGYRPWFAKGERVTLTVSGKHDTTFPAQGQQGCDLVLKCDFAQLQALRAAYAKKGSVQAMGLVSGVYAQYSDIFWTYGHLGGTVTKRAVEIAGAAYVEQVILPLNRTGTPGGSVRVVLYNDSSGLPGSAISGGTSSWVATSSIGLAQPGGPGEPPISYWIPFVLASDVEVPSVYHPVLESGEGYSPTLYTHFVAWMGKSVASGSPMEEYTGSWVNDPDFAAGYVIVGVKACDIFLVGELSERSLVPILDGDSALYHVPVRMLVKNA